MPLRPLMRTYVYRVLRRSEQSSTKGLGFVNGLVEMSEDVVEGISAGDVDVAGLKSRAVFGGTDGNAGSDRRAGLRLGVNRLLLLMAEMWVQLRSVDVPPQLKESGHVIAIIDRSNFAGELIECVMPRLQRSQKMANFDILSKLLESWQV